MYLRHFTGKIFKVCSVLSSRIFKVDQNVHFRHFTTYLSLEYTEKNDPAKMFMDTQVQNLLKSLTRIDLNKVFKKRRDNKPKLEQPVYMFMTEDQLQEVYKESQKQAEVLLQMPPAVKIRHTERRIYSHDPALEGLDTARLVITDISFGKKNSERLIVVREPDGCLQEAEWTLKDRMNQTYFPVEGKELRMPKMFQDEHLYYLLEKQEYVFLLDRACLQFEPNDPDYQRLVSTIYQFINDNNGFEALRSTRHFGPLTFFLVWFKMADNLLLELIGTLHIKESLDLLRLYGKIQNTEFVIKNDCDLDAIEKYIKEIASKKGALELALQSFRDFDARQKEIERGIEIAHGRM